MKSVSLDELIGKVSCRYELVTVISKRARMLIDNPDCKLIDSAMTAILITMRRSSKTVC